MPPGWYQDRAFSAKQLRRERRPDARTAFHPPDSSNWQLTNTTEERSRSTISFTKKPLLRQLRQ
jgi:hypothetical protein